MDRKLIFGIAVLALASACQREADPATSNDDDKPKNRRSSKGLAPRGVGGNQAESKTLRNSYAEENWPVAEEVESEWTKEFTEASTPEDKIEVVDRKQSSGPEQLAPLIRLSLREPDERVRAEAVMKLSSFAGLPRRSVGRVVGPPVDRSPAADPEDNGANPEDNGANPEDNGANPEDNGADPEDSEAVTQEEVVDLVVGATHDPSSEVRILAMEAALELPPEMQVEIYRRTIAVPGEGVRRMTITELGRMMSKPAFEVLLTGLEHPDSSFREQVNFELNLIVDRRFQSFEQARDWWDGSAGRFSDNMIEIGGSR